MLNFKITSPEKPRPYTPNKNTQTPYPAEGFFGLYFFCSDEFEPSDVVVQPSLVQSFEPRDFILFNSYDELQER